MTTTRKRPRRVPQVPRSTAEGGASSTTPPLPSRVPSGGAVAYESRGARPVAPRANFAEEYAYVRRDLLHTVVVTTLLIGGMIVIKVAGLV